VTIYGFDTTDRDQATAALLLYVVWRSRDVRRFKVTPDLWGQVERFTKASAKRATSIPRFLESIKPRFESATLNPKAMQIGMLGASAADDGAIVVDEAPGERREFLTQVLDECDEARVLDALYRETAWVVLLVRDRLEREKPIAAAARRAGATAGPTLFDEDDEETDD
jgi:hypothetical protein